MQISIRLLAICLVIRFVVSLHHYFSTALFANSSVLSISRHFANLMSVQWFWPLVIFVHQRSFWDFSYFYRNRRPVTIVARVSHRDGFLSGLVPAAMTPAT